MATLDAAVKEVMVPILELVPHSFQKKEIGRTIELEIKDIATNWGWKPAYVDLSLLNASLAGNAATCARRHIDYYRLKVGIVIDLKPMEHSKFKAAFEGLPMALRLRFEDLFDPSCKKKTEELLKYYKRRPQDADLILDLGEIANEAMQIASRLERVPFIDDWREITLLSGAFPRDLTNFEKNTQHNLPRYDWLSWLAFSGENPRRSANFGDYNISSGSFQDSEGKKYNFSASLRYTSHDHWVVMRGEGVFNEDGPGFDQYPAQAMLLCEREEFSGPTFSSGDLYIHQMAQQIEKSGGAKDWLTATVNHHLTFASRQVQSFLS